MLAEWQRIELCDSEKYSTHDVRNNRKINVHTSRTIRSQHVTRNSTMNERPCHICTYNETLTRTRTKHLRIHLHATKQRSRNESSTKRERVKSNRKFCLAKLYMNTNNNNSMRWFFCVFGCCLMLNKHWHNYQL